MMGLKLIYMFALLCAMSFTSNVLVGTGNAVAYQIIDTVSQYADSMPQWTQLVTNGEVIMITSGLILTGVAYFAWKRGMDVVAALGVELGPLLLVSGLIDIFKRKTSKLAQVAQIRRAPPPPVIAPPVPAGDTANLFTSQN